MAKIDDILKQYWGYSEFRPLQREIIESILQGRDTVVLLPTGGGKSITYQVPALALEGVTIVITPLIALMQDQVDFLKKLGINAAAINSSMTYSQIDATLDNCAYGDVKLLYVAPERVNTSLFKTRLMRINVSLIAVDEAHCISQWGFDFRPSYLKIVAIRKLLPEVPVVALTATATSVVLGDIVKHLEMREHNLFRASFTRQNIRFVVRYTDNKLDQILRIVNGVNHGSGIVYVRTRRDAQEVADYLVSQGVSANYYHAGLSFKMRSLRQNEWMQNKTRVIVATNAFGMGIDKADVRFVIHFQLPESIEAYYQEAGRAGRDGKISYAVALYGSLEGRSAMQRVALKYPPMDEVRKIYELFHNFLDIPIEEGENITREYDVLGFCTQYNLYSVNAISALKLLELGEYFVLTDENDRPTRIKIRIPRDTLYKIRVEQVDTDNFVKILLRSYTGLFNGFVSIDERYLSKVSGYTVMRIVEMLDNLSKQKIISCIPRRCMPTVTLLSNRIPTKDVQIDPRIYNLRKAQDELRAITMVDYAQSQLRCRMQVLCEYFDERNTKPCGQCDVCMQQKKSGVLEEFNDNLYQYTQKAILELINVSAEYDLKKLFDAIQSPSNVILNCVREMIATEQITQLPNGVLKKI